MNMKKISASGVLVGAIGVLYTPKVYAHEDKMNAADTSLAQKIHQDIAADSDLSPYAQNVKVVALNGKVILKGKVTSDSERQKIIDKVTGEAGVTDVDNKLEVKK